ncbi:MAG TPA: Crp/Fnr family transcriptional regulator [Marinilabiliales bacterium]|nr:MAG: cAMP-binding protein [Bacteroidetes bacterium GWC2_40_13]OFX71040.1 MAG: cAMP-binding protein [Bacteroidetes bacterium GWD2_40_43]OFX92529.1 MAG: cAMP-binding protein [Bacteroidetes bacterium GWE2_40_63]OFY16467.1 MAG: cAMP-binding protein [Bacteroidetes bacterium GWF2_40_13]OFZ27207.1 MAG: cAMP-binding protein [Bacteroidetes bacterium RIFOXYC2_FULL_40_12]HAM97850.1 Crp/Fnr family transcriptional regulator [Marinilabiliales bacterium]
MYQRLTNSPVFKGLTPEDIEKLIKQVNYRIKNVEAGLLIAQREEECTSLTIIIQGSVRGEMLDYSGKILKVEDIYAPRPIAAAFLFGQNNFYPVDVISNEETILLVIPKESVLKLFQLSDVFLKNYLNAISNRAQFLSRRIWFLSFKTIKGKLAQYILNMAEPDKTRIVLPLTQKDLAEFFGVTRPSLARALGEMEKDKIIEVNRKEITITNRNLLVKLLE